MQRSVITLFTVCLTSGSCLTNRAVEPSRPADAPGASTPRTNGVAPQNTGTHPAADRPAAAPRPPSDRTSDGFSFLVIGDTRSYPSRAEKNFRGIAALDPRTIAVFNAGDITAAGDLEGWQLHARAIERGGGGLIRRDLTDWKAGAIRYIGVVGNHDIDDAAWREHWNRFLPGQRDLGHNSEEGIYFALTHRDALFLVLDSAHPSDEQTAWLKRSLEQAPRSTRWRFAFFHHPVYPCSAKEPWVAGLPWARLFERHRVDVVFTGHTHTFERTCPLKGGRCRSGGVVYLNSSGGAAEARPVDREKVATAGSDRYDCSEILAEGIGRWHHFCRIAVAGDRLEGSCFGREGITRPRAPFTLSK